MQHLALKLIQNVIAIGSIKNLDTGSFFAINFVHLALKLIQHVITFRLIKNLDTGSYFVKNMVNFLALKLIQHVIATQYTKSPVIRTTLVVITLQKFNITISIDISIKTHKFVCIRQA